MFIPLITILKLIALGSIKLIFLLLGIAFFPRYALRFILGGATGMLLPSLDWLEENNKLAPERHRAIVDDLRALDNIEVTSKQARHLLWKLVRKTASNFVLSIKNGFSWIRTTINKLFQ